MLKDVRIQWVKYGLHLVVCVDKEAKSFHTIIITNSTVTSLYQHPHYSPRSASLPIGEDTALPFSTLIHKPRFPCPTPHCITETTRLEIQHDSALDTS